MTESLAIYEEYLDLPIDAPANLHGFALDIGASLTKLVVVADGEKTPNITNGRQSSVRLRLMTFQNDQLDLVLEFIKANGLPKGDVPQVTIGYGHGVQRARDKINSSLGITIDYTDEFTSFGRGFHHLFKNMPLDQLLHDEERAIPRIPLTQDDKFPLILNFLGSAIVYLSISERPDGKPKMTMVEGMQRGGLYFLCMGRMLFGIRDFKELISLVEKGDPKNVDVVVNKDGVDKTAFPLGKIWKEDMTSSMKEDVAASFYESMLDDIKLVASNVMNAAKAKCIYFVGSFARNNTKFRKVMKTLPEWETQHGRPPVKVGFPKYEGYIGAIGAFILGVEKLADPNTSMTQMEFDMKHVPRVMAEAGMTPQEMAQMAQMMGVAGPPGGPPEEGLHSS